MTNANLQAMITKFGDRISVITLDNDLKIFIGYPQSKTCRKVSDIILTNEFGSDMFGIRMPSNLSGDAAAGVTHVTYHDTACIQSVLVMDEGFMDYRVDPMLLK